MSEDTGSTIRGLLEGLGILDAPIHDRVAAAVESEIAGRGLTGSVLGIRWGCVTVTTDPEAFGQLQWLRDVLAQTAARASDGKVTDIRIKSKEGNRT